MIRKIKNQDGSGFNDSKIISTRDIFLGTNVTSSLEEYLKNQEDELNQLKKWTKWYVKYGGMGSGGGGGTGSSRPDCNIYLKKGTTYSNPVNNGATVILQGNGTYTLTFTIVRGSGHTFHVKWKFGEGREQEKYINENSSTISTTVDLNKRTTFTYSVTDDTIGEDVTSGEATIIPEQFTISTEISYKEAGVLNNGDPVSLGTVKNGFIAKYWATVSYPVDVFYQVRYQLEGNDWIYVGNENIFKRPETIDDNAKSDTYSIEIDFPQDITDENYVGKKITFELLYGTTSGSLNTDSSSTYYITVTPSNGYYILISEPDDYKNTLVSNPTDIDNAEEINRGSIPFYIMLCADQSNVPQSLDIYLFRHKDNVDTWGDDTWESVLLHPTEQTPISVSSNIKTNVKYSIAKQFDIGTSRPGVYKIIGFYNEFIQTVKYFTVKQNSTEWDYYRIDEKLAQAEINCTHTYYPGNTTPDFSKPLELFKNSSEVNIASSIGFDRRDTQFSSIFNLGVQYSNSNDDNVPFIKFDVGDSTSPTYIYVYQNKIYYNETDKLVDQFYFPKIDFSNDEDNWHLFTFAINLIKTDVANTRFFEITVFIDGILEGIYVSSGSTLNNSVPLNILKVTLNPTENHILKINLFDFNFWDRTNKPKLSFTNDNSNFKGKYSYLLDNYISSYFNKYLSSIKGDSAQINDSIEFNENIFNFSFDEYGMPYTSIGVLNNLISSKDSNGNKVLNVPVLVLNPNENSFSDANIDRDSQNNLIDKPFLPNWFLARWPESPSDNKGKPLGVTGKIFYIPEDVTSNVENNEIKNVSFTFEIQGSSTRAYGIKNLELSIVQTEGSTKLFTPNFDEHNSSSLLPEQSFTLKADLVDSSACNNNAIGDFVNKNTTPLDASHVAARQSHCGDHIKNCLTGFPVLVFLNISPAEENSDPYYKRYYYLGIYNFNLGRNSYINLGYYKDISTYEEIWDKLINSPKGFKIIEINEDKLILNPNLVVTEISNGNPYFDFSQYNESVLFSGQDNDDYSMFSADDTVEGSSGIAKSVLSSAVKQISLAGGFLFSKLNKNFIKLGFAGPTAEIRLPYLLNKDGVSLNCVSDYRTQYTRISGDTTYNEIPGLAEEGTKNNLLNCIGIDPETNIPPYVDLRSLVEYYVICMCFGMVDSVLKNLEIKTWSPRQDARGNAIPATIYLAFYDMDTALGIDNSGNSVSYFAFSDYWETINNQIGNSVEASTANIYPDFFYKRGDSGYDIPSSYLFSIAKYSFLENLNLSEDELNTFPKLIINNISYYLTPVNLYSYFRDQNGQLKDAESFINTYFKPRLEKIPNSLKNLNYRSKYAKICYWNIESFNNKIRVISDAGTISMTPASNLTDISKFNGTGIERKLDWLTSRLHLLDAYFNVNSNIYYPINYPTFYSDEDGINQIELGRETDNVFNFINNTIKKIDWNNSVEILTANDTYRPAYYMNNTSIATFSDDVSLVKEMFEGEHKDNLSTSLTVKAPSFTPIIFSVAGYSPAAYLIGDSTGTLLYSFGMASTGNTDWHLYGSREFTYVQNLGHLNLNRNITLISNKLQEINFIDTYVEYTESITLITPNINSITFSNSTTGKNFKASLILDSSIKYPRLSSISLNNTRMSLEVHESLNLPITSLDLENTNSNKVSILNAVNLKNVKLNGSTFIDLTLPVWSKTIRITGNSGSSDFDYYNVNIKNLTIQKNSNFGTDTTLILDSIKDLQTVVVGINIKELTIRNCKNLTSVRITSEIVTLRIESCSTTASYLSVGTTSLTNNLINLTECSKLQNINFKNTANFTKVNIGKNQGVKIEKNGFLNCKNLQYIDNVDNGDYSGYYLINGSACFMNSYNFTLRRCSKDSEDSEKYPNLLFETSDPKGCFYLSSYSNNNHIDFDAVNEFFNRNYNALVNNKRRIERVTNIDNLFYNQAGIGEAWAEAARNGNGFNVNFDHLSGFINVVSAKFAFWRTGINYWTKELFNFGKFADNGLYIDSCFWNGVGNETHVKIDFLENIGPKLRSLIDYSGTDGSNGDGGTGGIYRFYDGNGNELTNINLQSVFGKCKTGDSSYITQVKIFYKICDRTSDNKPVIVDLRDCFDGFKNVTLISHFIYDMSNWKNLTYLNSNDEPKSCLHDCPKLQNIHTCFSLTSKIITTDPNGYAITDNKNNELYTNEIIDLRHFLTDDQWEKTTFNIFSTNNGNRGANFNCQKEIEYKDFNTLKDLLTSYYNNMITNFGPIFRNTDILNCSDSSGNHIPLLNLKKKQTEATSFFFTFANIRAYSGDRSSERIPTKFLEEDTGNSIFYNYSNCSSIRGIYSSNWFSDSIPLNFFNLRRESRIVHGYFPHVIQDNLDKLNKNKEYIYYISSFESSRTPEQPDLDPTRSLDELIQAGEIPSSGIDCWITNKPALSNLTEDPKIMKIATSLTKKSIWVSYRDKGASLDTPRIFPNAVLLEEFKEPIRINARYTLYKSSNLSDLSSAFSSCKWVKPYCYYSDQSDIYQKVINEESYIREEDNSARTYTYYYTDPNCTTLDLFYRKSTEVDDLKLGQGNNNSNKISTSDGNSTTDGNNTIKLGNFQIFNNEDTIYPLIPPDFFYGLSSNITIDNLFNSSNTSSLPANSGGTGSYNAIPSLEGYLPPHLFSGSTVTSVTTLENWIRNCDVLPILYNEIQSGEKPIRNYLFIPQNFLSFSHPRLGNAFNFHIRIPKESDNYIEHYYIMSQESITKTGKGVSLYLNNTFPEYTTHGDRGLPGSTYVINTKNNNVFDVSSIQLNINLYLIGLTDVDLENNPTITNGGINDLGSTWSLSSFDNLISADLLFVLRGNIINYQSQNPRPTLNQMLSNVSNGKSLFKAWSYGIVDTDNYAVRGINQNCRLPVADSNFSTYVQNSKVFSHKLSVGCINMNSLGSQSSEISYWNNSFGITVVRQQS